MENYPNEILIVDDEEMIRCLLRDHLTAKGNICHEAANGAEAMSMLRECSYDLVISDINMPKLDGLSLLKYIRKREKIIGVILITGFGGVTNAIDALKAGVDDYILKPFKLDELEICVANVLEKISLKRALEIYQHHLEEKVQEQARIIQNQFYNSVKALARALEARDGYTQGHTQRVSELAVLMAHEMNWNENEIKELELGSLLHDIGKIGIPDGILNKKAKLAPSEYFVIKSHPKLGKEIISHLNPPKMVIDTIYQHHEHVDGSGYPHSLKDGDINPGAKILSVADVFDALTSHRSYRKAMSIEEAVNLLKSQKGISFDPQIVDTLVNVVGRRFC